MTALRNMGAFLVAFVLLAGASAQANIAVDDASNYTSWTNNSNGGNGFQPWDLTGNNSGPSVGTTNFAGYFLGDSTAGSGDINTSGQSFGIFANDNGGTGSAFADAARDFDNPLSQNETFTIQLAVNFRNGNKGLDLQDAANNGIFNFNVGNNEYQVNGTPLGLVYEPDSVFDLTFFQGSGTQVGVQIIRTTAGQGVENAYSQILNVGAAVDGFKLYNSGTDDGQPENNLYANNMNITVPEPASAMLMLAGTVLALAMRRRVRG